MLCLATLRTAATIRAAGRAAAKTTTTTKRAAWTASAAAASTTSTSISDATRNSRDRITAAAGRNRTWADTSDNGGPVSVGPRAGTAVIAASTTAVTVPGDRISYAGVATRTRATTRNGGGDGSASSRGTATTETGSTSSATAAGETTGGRSRRSSPAMMGGEEEEEKTGHPSRPRPCRGPPSSASPGARPTCTITSSPGAPNRPSRPSSSSSSSFGSPRTEADAASSSSSLLMTSLTLGQLLQQQRAQSRGMASFGANGSGRKKRRKKLPKHKNPFVVLDLKEGETTFPAAKRSFLKIAMSHHPDTTSAETEEEREEHRQIFVAAREAFELLAEGPDGLAMLRSETDDAWRDRDDMDQWFRSETGHDMPYMDAKTMKEVAEMTTTVGGGLDRDGGMWTLARMITDNVKNKGGDGADVLRLEAGTVRDQNMNGMLRRRRRW